MGIAAAITILILWGGHLAFALLVLPGDPSAPVTYGHMIIQGYLYTGLFITAHDSMHGSISTRRGINRMLGVLALRMFAAFSYGRMFSRHMDHHRWPGTQRDPDFSSRQNFFIWLILFFSHYVTVVQLVIMAGVFNILRYAAGIAVENLVLFWIIPAFLSTLQLFFFGTYLPHRYPHTEAMKPHYARSQRRNHLWAMISCYFFGYHYEHHEHPRVPWWKLHRYKPKQPF